MEINPMIQVALSSEFVVGPWARASSLGNVVKSIMFVSSTDTPCPPKGFVDTEAK
jgi:hypothetical protein